MRWCIQQAKVPAGGTILDPYAGSGSTIVAAVTMGYPAIGIEISEQYFEIMVRRVTEAQRQGDLLRDAPPGSEPYPRWAQAGLL
jgi:DNA modification methylase